MIRIRLEHAERGRKAEREFQQWLDRSGVPYLYATQDIESVPAYYQGRIKRPDYLVGLPYMATVAFDVKSKSTYGGAYLFDVPEIRRLAHFADLFQISTFFACLDPEGGPSSRWLRVAELMELDPEKRARKEVIAAPIAMGIPVDMSGR